MFPKNWNQKEHSGPDSVPECAAAAKLFQSCPTLCDPIDGSPPGSPVPGILQPRTLEWAAISFSNTGQWKVKVKSLSRAWLVATPWTAAHPAPLSMGFSRQEYWGGVPLPSPPECETMLYQGVLCLEVLEAQNEKTQNNWLNGSLEQDSEITDLACPQHWDEAQPAAMAAFVPGRSRKKGKPCYREETWALRFFVWGAESLIRQAAG